MSMPSFKDYLDENPIDAGLRGNAIAESIYDTMSEPRNVHRMILASEAGEPALSGCIAEIEAQYGKQKIFDLEVNFNRQALGRMVKTVLKPFCYHPDVSKRIKKGLSKYVTTASVYRKPDGCTPSLRVVVDIRIVECGNRQQVQRDSQ